MWMRASPNSTTNVSSSRSEPPFFAQNVYYYTVVVRYYFDSSKRFPRSFFFFCAFRKKLGREFFETARRKHSGIDRIENNREGAYGKKRRAWREKKLPITTTKSQSYQKLWVVRTRRTDFLSRANILQTDT